MASFGMANRLSLVGGGHLDAVRLGLVDAGSLVHVGIDPTSAPDLSSQVVGVPGFNAGGDVVLFSDFGGRLDGFLVPSNESGGGEGKLWTVGTFEQSGARSRSFVRGIGLPEASAAELRLQTGKLSPAPVLSAGSGEVTVAGSAALFEFRAYQGEELVAEGVLLPSAPSQPLPLAVGSGMRVEVVGYDADVNRTEFSRIAVHETAAGIAQSSIGGD
jgi:hypothetical protein